MQDSKRKTVIKNDHLRKEISSKFEPAERIKVCVVFPVAPSLRMGLSTLNLWPAGDLKIWKEKIAAARKGREPPRENDGREARAELGIERRAKTNEWNWKRMLILKSRRRYCGWGRTSLYSWLKPFFIFNALSRQVGSSVQHSVITLQSRSHDFSPGEAAISEAKI